MSRIIHTTSDPCVTISFKVSDHLVGFFYYSLHTLEATHTRKRKKSEKICSYDQIRSNKCHTFWMPPSSHFWNRKRTKKVCKWASCQSWSIELIITPSGNPNTPSSQRTASWDSTVFGQQAFKICKLCTLHHVVRAHCAIYKSVWITMPKSLSKDFKQKVVRMCTRLESFIGATQICFITT